MHALVLLGIISVTALAEGVDKRECEKIFDPEATSCCKKSFELQEKLMNIKELKECFNVNMDPATCEHDLCIAKTRGFVTDDKKMDKKKLEELVILDLGSDPDLMKDMKSKCFNGDLDKYGPPEFCDLFKNRLCMTAQLLKHCPEWNDTDSCKEFKGLVQECAKTIY